MEKRREMWEKGEFKGRWMKKYDRADLMRRKIVTGMIYFGNMGLYYQYFFKRNSSYPKFALFGVLNIFLATGIGSAVTGVPPYAGFGPG